MNITFFIGNGFDINIGLKTKYSDFYPYFKKRSQEKNMIRNWIDGHEQDWADLEEKLGQEIERVSEEELEKFYEDKEELDKLLIEYLESEQRKYIFEDKEQIIKEFSRSMLDFSSGLPMDDVESIKETMEKYKNEDFIYSYIIFNYTNILDKIIALYNKNSRVISNHQCNGGVRSNSIGKTIHIHGTTNEEMILGVNDEGQIKNDFLKKDSLFLDTFIKKRMNRSIGQRKTDKVLETINKSHIICIFGMSLGNTDKMWWEELIKWLITNENNKLVIFWKEYEAALKRKLPSTLIRLNEQIRKEIYGKGKGKYDDSYYSKIKNRIMISYNSDIFSLPKIQENKILEKTV